MKFLKERGDGMLFPQPNDREMVQDDPLGVSAVIEFLKTGNMECIIEDDRLKPYVELSEAIFQVGDKQKRDELLEQLGRMQIERDFRTIAEGRVNVDVVSVFEDQHLRVLKQFVEKGRLDDARMAMEILRISNRWNLGINHPKSQAGTEYLMHYYPHMLLQGDVDVGEVYEQVKYFESLISFQDNSAPGYMAAVVMSETMQTFNLEKYASDNKLSSPIMILSAVIGRLVDDPEKRSQISDYMHKYEDTLIALHLADEDEDERIEKLRELDTMAKEVWEEYPELTFIHNRAMAVYFIQRDPAIAGEYYKKALDYYTHDYERRKGELGVEYDLWHKDKQKHKRDRNLTREALREKYADYERIVSEYSP